MGRHAAATKRVAQRPSDAVIEERIRSRIGKPVRFKYPGNAGTFDGILKDRVVIRSNPANTTGVPHWDVIDLMEFPDKKDSPWMRVGYYRHVNGKLVWGGQTTLTKPFSTWKRLFEAAETRPWFAPFLRAGSGRYALRGTALA